MCMEGDDGGGDVIFLARPTFISFLLMWEPNC